MKKQKYYAVWKGRRRGIYLDWESCAAQVKGFPGAQYMTFGTREEAERALHGSYEEALDRPASNQKWLLAAQPPRPGSYVVDAACSGSPGRLEWRGVNLASGKVLFHEGPYQKGTNNIGEFLAVVQALQLLARQHLALPVYTDSATALAWVRRGKCRTSLKPERVNAPLFTLIARAEAWLQEHPPATPLLKWDTNAWGEIPADFNRK